MAFNFANRPMKTRLTSRTASLTLVIAAGAGLATLAPPAAAECTEFAAGLLRPLGITQSNRDNLLVAEAGTATPNNGRVSIVDPAGTRRTLIEGLPSGISYEANAPSGPTGVFLRGRTLYIAIGVGDAVSPGPSQGTARPNPNPSSPLLSSILALQFSAAVEKNTQGFSLTPADHQTLAAGQPVTLSNAAGETARIEMIVNFPDFTSAPLPQDPDNVRNTNPFALLALGDRLFVTDGGQNLIWRVDLSARAFSTLTAFDRIPNPQFNPNPPPPSLGGPFLEAVPTGITYADGQLIVTLFRGFPFPSGTSTVMSVDPVTGSQIALINGLKTAIRALPIIADDDQSAATKYLVLQHASGPVQTPPGLLLLFDNPATEPTTLASCLTAPVSMILDPQAGTLYITELGGRIVTIPLAAQAQQSDGGRSPLVRNISTRSRVQSGDNVMIAGFIIDEGTGFPAVRVVVRAIGPSLADDQVADPLQDPVLTLHDSNGVELARNDNWKGDEDEPSQQPAIEATGLAPSNDAESALIATLTPGNYTAIVRGSGDAAGVALVEVYHVQ